MKVRIRFSKTGALVYIGHLDVMRYFQKLFRRSHIPVKYSEGFSPHQILSFTPPLPLGMESTGEYADVELSDTITSYDAMRALSEASVPEIKIMSFKELPEGSENAMASVRAAGYKIVLDDPDSMDISGSVRSLLSKDKIEVLKKTKKSEKIIDIRPLIYELKAEEDGIYMLISSGSTDNIKPELVLSQLTGLTDRNVQRIIRYDQYTMAENGLSSLDLIGHII